MLYETVRDSNPSAEGAGNACERRLRRIQRAGVGAAVEKIEEKRKPEDFFGHRKRSKEIRRISCDK